MPNYTIKSYLLGLALSIGTSAGALLMSQLQSKAIDWYALGVVCIGVFVASLIQLKAKWDGTERRELEPVTQYVGVEDRRKSRQLPPEPPLAP